MKGDERVHIWAGLLQLSCVAGVTTKILQHLIILMWSQAEQWCCSAHVNHVPALIAHLVLRPSHPGTVPMIVFKMVSVYWCPEKVNVNPSV